MGQGIRTTDGERAHQRRRWTALVVGALAAAALLPVASTQADFLAGDELSMLNPVVDLGRVCGEVPTTADSGALVVRSSSASNPASVSFADSAVLPVTVMSVSSPDVTVTVDPPATIALPSNWGDQANGFESATAPLEVSVTSSTPGPLDESVQLRVRGPNAAGDQISRFRTFRVKAEVVECDPPHITIATPSDDASFSIGALVVADYTCTDPSGGSVPASGAASCVGPVPSGSPIDTGAVGPRSFTVNAADNAGNVASLTHSYSVVWPFAGFRPPVGPGVNTATAGRTIPLKFSLGGDRGLDIFAPGSPTFAVVPSCSPSEAASGGAPIASPGGDGLKLTGGGYHLNWKTPKGLKGCYQVILKFADGQTRRATFRFG